MPQMAAVNSRIRLFLVVFVLVFSIVVFSIPYISRSLLLYGYVILSGLFLISLSNLRHYIPQHFSATVYDQIRIFFIQRGSLLVQVPLCLTGLQGHTSGIQISQPLFHFLIRKLQIYHGADIPQMLHALRLVAGASAGGNDAVFQIQRGIYVALDLPEALHAVFRDEFMQ